MHELGEKSQKIKKTGRSNYLERHAINFNPKIQATRMKLTRHVLQLDATILMESLLFNMHALRTLMMSCHEP